MTDNNPHHSNFFAQALRSALTGADRLPDIELTAQNIDEIVRSGLGPLFYRLAADSPRLPVFDPANKLRAADMTARVLTADLLENTAWTLGILTGREIPVTVLKGMSFALTYYPDPHLRTMGDVDLLLSPAAVAEAEQVLIEHGFEPYVPETDFDYDAHIHSAPLFHPDRRLWIELHRRLLPDGFAASQEPPLDLKALQRNVSDGNLLGSPVGILRPEFELMYLAAGWCFDLTHAFGPALRRGLFDCAVLLRATARSLDWELLMRWSRGTLGGACLLVLLSFLVRCGAYRDETGICRRLKGTQAYVNPTTLGIMHSRINRHLVSFEPYGRLSSQSVTASVFDALLRKKSAWRNLLAVPGCIMFPRHESRKFQLGFQLGRLRRVAGRR